MDITQNETTPGAIIFHDPLEDVLASLLKQAERVRNEPEGGYAISSLIGRLQAFVEIAKEGPASYRPYAYVRNSGYRGKA